jgi:hypothetical protein
VVHNKAVSGRVFYVYSKEPIGVARALISVLVVIRAALPSKQSISEWFHLVQIAGAEIVRSPSEQRGHARMDLTCGTV